MKYLTLIRAIALVHQHQRPVKTVEHRGATLRYIEVTKEDIAVADRLCADVLGHGLDELPPQTRRLLEMITSWVGELAKSEAIEAGLVRFSRKDLREVTRWTDTVLRKHLARLVELEHVMVHGGGQNRATVYGLAFGYDDRPGSISGLPAPHLLPARSPRVSRQNHRENKGKERVRSPAAKAHLEGAPDEAGASETYSLPNGVTKANGKVN